MVGFCGQAPVGRQFLTRPVETLADSPRPAGPDVVDPAGPGPEGECEHGLRHITHIDEITARVQVTDVQDHRIATRLRGYPESRFAPIIPVGTGVYPFGHLPLHRCVSPIGPI